MGYTPKNILARYIIIKFLQTNGEKSWKQKEKNNTLPITEKQFES